VLRVGCESCPHCCRTETYISKAQSIWEDFIMLLLLRLVRCRSVSTVLYG
jgi:hypothetical protein